MGRIFMAGDTHGWTRDTKKLTAKGFPESRKLTKEDVVIQLGDFGWVWYPFGQNKEQEHWLNYLATRTYTLVVCLGNHENYDEIETLPLIDKFGGTVRVIERDSKKFGKGEIYLLERGQVYTINGKTFFAFGGAKSYDMTNRIEGKSWWRHEVPTYAEFEQGMVALDEVNWEVDYIISHTCPTTIMGEFIHISEYEPKFKDPVAEYLSEVYKKIKFKEWHFGHHHMDLRVDLSNTDDGIFQCHFKKQPYELSIS
jgi:hypothetical protein